MLRFFRRLRRSMIANGKLKSYLLYAAGEILLIVIGVLLAIQVNAMQERRAERKSELAIYGTIKDQLLNYRSILEDDAGYNQRYLAQFAYAGTLIAQNDRTRLDTLGKIARNMINYSDFDATGNIYESLVNSGEINLLHNPDIVEGVRQLEEDFLYVNRMENIHYDAVLAYVIPGIQPLVTFSTGAVQAPEALFEPDFQNLLLLLLRIMEEKADAYQSTLDTIAEVVERIEGEVGTD